MDVGNRCFKISIDKDKGIVLLEDIERNVVYSNMPYSYRICKESEDVKIVDYKVIEDNRFKEVVLNVLIGDVEGIS